MNQAANPIVKDGKMMWNMMVECELNSRQAKRHHIHCNSPPRPVAMNRMPFATGGDLGGGGQLLEGNNGTTEDY